METNHLMKILERLRVMEGDMTIRRLHVLLAVHQAGTCGIELQNLAKLTDTYGGSLTKIVQSWGHRTRDMKPGPKYLTVEPLPDNLSTKITKITPRGTLAVEAILDE